MDEKTTELIAIGVSIGAHCQPCLAYHLDKARQLGISEDLIQEAIRVGYMVEKGASNAMKTYVNQILSQPQGGEACCSGGDSGCCT